MDLVKLLEKAGSSVLLFVSVLVYYALSRIFKVVHGLYTQERDNRWLLQREQQSCIKELAVEVKLLREELVKMSAKLES